MSKMAVVIVGYNRIPGMLRLLHSLEAADYGDDTLTLIISLDNCGCDEPYRAAEQFQWSHGEKILRTFPERQGLRRHILSCGEYLNAFDAIAVLEDDVVVSPGYYHYMKQAVAFYQNDDRIAGISLYSHRVNVNVYAPFIPQPDGSDVFFLQFAQSWGQVWMKRQWFAFRDWYLENRDKPVAAENVPSHVSHWKDTSWLKYHVKYCIEADKFFVYPYEALSTCFNDVGQHTKKINQVMQVPLCAGSGREYRFSSLDEGCRYDAYFERQGLGKSLGVPEEDLCVDLYGAKRGGKRKYCLSVKPLPYAVVKSYGLAMRPHEANVICNVPGEDIYLYDTTVSAPAPKENVYRDVAYYYNMTAGFADTAAHFWGRVKNGLRGKLCRKK